MFVTAVENTARVEAESQLRRRRRSLRHLNETLEQQVEARTRERDRVWTNSRDLLVVIGADGVFRAVSPAWTERARPCAGGGRRPQLPGIHRIRTMPA